LNIESDYIECKASSGSSITIKGMALNMEATASSGSDIDAKDLLANKVNAAGSSGATISVHPIVSLKPKRAVAILTIILPQNQSKRSSSGASIDKI
jgi:hypothetical protein